MVAAHGFPEAAAYGVYLGEVAGPVMVLLGLFARVGGALIAINMLVAVFLVGMARATTFNAMGGYALELEAFYFWCAVAVMFLGAGRFSIAGGRWN
jgi:putative oxidoreductase